MNGVLPNSDVNMTRVSSSIPLDFKSLIRAATGWSILKASRP